MIIFPHDFQISSVTTAVIANDAPASIKKMAEEARRIYGNLIQICDGTADDVQIQAAIDELPTAGGKVYISPGTFNITTGISVVNPVSIEGSGRDSTQIIASGAIDIFVFNPASYWTNKGATLKDVSIVNGRYGVYLSNTPIKTNLYDVDFVGQSDFGLYDLGSQNCGFYNLHFYNCGMASASTGGIYLAGNSMNFYNTRIDACGTGLTVVAGYSSGFYGVYVEGNQFHGIVGNGTATNFTLMGLGMEMNGQSGPGYNDINLVPDASNWSIVGARISTSPNISTSIDSTIGGLHLINVSPGAICAIKNERNFVSGLGNYTNTSQTGDYGREYTLTNYNYHGVENKTIRMRNINEQVATAPAGSPVRIRASGGSTWDCDNMGGTGSYEVIGVTVSAILYAEYGQVQTAGKVTNLRVNGTTPISIGTYLSNYDRWVAGAAASGHTAFAIANAAYAGADSNGVIEAYLITPRRV